MLRLGAGEAVGAGGAEGAGEANSKLYLAYCLLPIAYSLTKNE
ncbi:hypothetical protein [Coleofasciculus sp. F4-SAH-05]